MTLSIPSWKDRLKACFQWRHRLLHVFGVPAAVAAVTAVVTANALNPDVGLSIGVLTAGIGSLLAGYYVTAGFDRSLIENLRAEQHEENHEIASRERQQILASADASLQPVLRRIVHCYDSIEAVFKDGIDDEVEAVLQHSRADLRELHDRALGLVQLFQKLRQIVEHSDADALAKELERTERKLRQSPEAAVKAALLASKQSSERALSQWQAAIDKQEQVRSVLTVIEGNLQEFKVAMELRKADVVMGEHGKTLDVSELQARLSATGEACDDLVGRGKTRRERRERRARA